MARCKAGLQALWFMNHWWTVSLGDPTSLGGEAGRPGEGWQLVIGGYELPEALGMGLSP